MTDPKPVKPKSGVDFIGTFNNEGRDDVEEVKRAAADLIDMIQLYGHDDRRNGLATTHIEVAAMMAVKSIFT